MIRDVCRIWTEWDEGTLLNTLNYELRMMTAPLCDRFGVFPRFALNVRELPSLAGRGENLHLSAWTPKAHCVESCRVGDEPLRAFEAAVAVVDQVNRMWHSADFQMAAYTASNLWC